MVIYNMIVILFDTFYQTRLLYIRNKVTLNRTSFVKKLKSLTLGKATCACRRSKAKKTTSPCDKDDFSSLPAAVKEETIKENQVICIE